MIRFHPSITMTEAHRVAGQLDCALVPQPNGDLVITPHSLLHKPNNPAGNSNVRKMERHRAQYIGAHLPTLPDGPEAA